MKKEKRRKSFAYSIGTGVFAVFLFLLFYFAVNKNTAPFMLILREVFPFYEEGVTSVMNLYAYGGGHDEHDELDEETIDDNYIEAINIPEGETIPGDLDVSLPVNSVEILSAPEIIGINNVVYQPGTDISLNDNPQTDLLTIADRELFSDFDYLKGKLYTVDKRTELLPSDINPEEFLNMSFKFQSAEEDGGPKVLIFHTHSQEGYSDSVTGDINDGIFAVGERLKEILETKYAIEALHDRSSYDVVDGKSSTLGAYERMEPSISKILEENPSIELVIDMHRDGVAENVRFVTNINGKETAKIMLFNGLCRVYSNGVLAEIPNLANPFIKDNLALSFNLQLLANELYPDFTRKIYINAYRYSLHFKPKSLLIEVGAQTNTKQEALNAMEPLAETLAELIK